MKASVAAKGWALQRVEWEEGSTRGETRRWVRAQFYTETGRAACGQGQQRLLGLCCSLGDAQAQSIPGSEHARLRACQAQSQAKSSFLDSISNINGRKRLGHPKPTNVLQQCLIQPVPLSSTGTGTPFPQSGLYPGTCQPWTEYNKSLSTLQVDTGGKLVEGHRLESCNSGHTILHSRQQPGL